MSELNKIQVDILENTLAWPKRYRNHYYAMLKSRANDLCKELVSMGLMEVKDISFHHIIYSVTEKGIQYLEKRDSFFNKIKKESEEGK